MKKSLEKGIRKSISLVELIGSENRCRYKILRTKSAKIFDELAVFTANLFHTRIAVISFVDQHNVWKQKGQRINELPGSWPETNVCSLAIVNESVADFTTLSKLPTLITNPIIASEMGMRFYVAVPIINDEGVRIGSVCIADHQQRTFLPEEMARLEWVAEAVKKEMKRKSARMSCA